MSADIFSNLIAPSLVALLTSVLWGFISDGSNRRQAFKLEVGKRAREAITTARHRGVEYRNKDLTHKFHDDERQLKIAELVGLQADVVSEISILRSLGFDAGSTLDDFSDALTGGDFDSGQRSSIAVQKILLAAANPCSSISEFEANTVHRPIVSFLSRLFMPPDR